MSIDHRFLVSARGRAGWGPALLVVVAGVCLPACVGEGGSMTPRAGDAPRTSTEQHYERGGNPGTSAEISHGNGRAGEHKGAGHR